MIIRPEAEDDLRSARDWYESRQVGLGDEFGAEVDAALQRLETIARRIVTRLESSFPLGAKACGDIRPGVALRFHRGKEYVTALICFHCKEWYFEVGNESDGGKHRGKLNIEGAHAELLQLVQSLFPDDGTINAIISEDRYTIAYQVPEALPSKDDDIRSDAELGSTGVLVKYVSEAATKVKNWDQTGGLNDSALPLDGLLFIHTTEENHRIISQVPGVRAVP
jgi:hypothetical protein